ncbi:MAG: hypothetical protein U5Q44_07960 [Dehalococcoidia bacterium]|nr:hypothetical protein [Dehalococcoidia bacterium]
MQPWPAWAIQDRGPRTGHLVAELFDMGVDVVIADNALQVGRRLREFRA